MDDDAIAPAPGTGPSTPAIERAMRFARRLSGCCESYVVLREHEKPWPSRNACALSGVESAAELALTTGEPLWVEDVRRDARFRDNPVVLGPPAVRAFAAAPILGRDGTAIGVLCIVDKRPRRFDEQIAEDLRELALGLADACEGARAPDAQSLRTKDETTQPAGEAVANLRRATPTSLMMTDRNLRLIHATPRWLSEMDLEEDNSLGRTVADLLPAYFETNKVHFERCLAGEAFRAERVKAPRSQEWRQAEFKPWRTESGEVGGVIVVSHNITEIVEALSRAERAEERLTLALDLSEIHVWELDLDQRTLVMDGNDFANERPWTFDELYTDIWQTIDPRDRPAVKAMWAEHLRSGAPYKPEYRAARSDGKEIWVSGLSRLITDGDGRPLRLLGAEQHISERKAHELALIKAKQDAESANQAKSAFLATMSHEIRTPLNGVLGMAQALSLEELSDAQREKLDVIRQSGETLLAILNDFLDLSKIEAGKLDLERVEFDMGELARGAHATFASIADKKGVAFRLAVSARARGIWLGDATRIRQVLYNLISNALKFTDAGGVWVSVGCNGQSLKIKVRDTGIGMTPEQLSRLFQKFEQADISTTRRFGGTGLGLAICHELAALMGGSIQAKSADGRGTTFIVQLPLQYVGESEMAAEPAQVATAGPADECSSAVLKVLAAEDNRVNQLVLRTLLAQVGIEPHIVDDGAAAVAAWESGEWDMILMDVQMPVMDGPTATELIRKQEALAGRGRTPIFALTANAMAHQVAEYQAAGMDGVLSKPIQVTALFAAVKAVLQAAGTRPQKPEEALDYRPNLAANKA